MVIETFKTGCFEAVYQRFEKHGRLLPEGLHYLDSWVTGDQTVCYQLMETVDRPLFDSWVSQWQDLVEFEIIPLVDRNTNAS